MALNYTILRFDYFAGVAAAFAFKSTCNNTSSFTIDPPAPVKEIPKSLRLIANSSDLIDTPFASTVTLALKVTFLGTPRKSKFPEISVL